MHEDYEDDDYDDYENYDNSQDNLESQYKKFYFKFDPTAWDSWGKWIQDAIDDIIESSPNVWYVPGFPFKSIPVNDYFSGTGKDKTLQYLGNNHYKEPIYKTKYFIHNKLDTDYRKHLIANAVHFLQQPNYYDGMFEILN